MKSILFALSLSLFFNYSYSQLDPKYFGTYIAEDELSFFTVYTMDEVVDDCFVIDFEVYENNELIYGASGFGSCDGPNGHWLIQLEGEKTPREIEFKEEEGSGVVLILHEKGTLKEYYHFEESELIEEDGDSVDDYVDEYMDEYAEEMVYEEFVFVRQDGSELIIYPEGEFVGFTLSGALSEKCEGNEVTGVMMPMDEEMTLFEFKGEDGCRIEFQISTDSINIIEESCGFYRGIACADWNGLYVISQ